MLCPGPCTEQGRASQFPCVTGGETECVGTRERERVSVSGGGGHLNHKCGSDSCARGEVCTENCDCEVKLLSQGVI